MNEKFLELAEKIFENEKLLEKVLKCEIFDKLYDIIKSESNSKISRTELKEFMDNYNQKNLSEAKLNLVSGGANGSKNKVIASALSFLIMAQMGAGIASAKDSNKSETAVTPTFSTNKSKAKAGVIAGSVAGVIAGSVGTVFVAAIVGLFAKKFYDTTKLIRAMSFEQLLARCDLSDNWKLGTAIQRKFTTETLLLTKVHSRWESFWTAFRKVKNLPTTKIRPMETLEAAPTSDDSSSTAVMKAITTAVWRSAINCPFEGTIGRNAWMPGQIIYKQICNSEKFSTNLGSAEYFTNLVTVLDKQTEYLKKVLDEQTKNLKAVQ